MAKFWIFVILGVLMCSMDSARSGIAKPANVKKKNINIELNVNLGLGNDSCIYKCVGPCYPGCTNHSYPGPLTHIPNTPRHRNFEKVGEYIKVRLCSYLYDDGKTCEFYCALLGYLRYTCIDLDTCHCFKKSDVPLMSKARTISDQCTDDSQCVDYCLTKNHHVYECNDGRCRCSDTPSNSNESLRAIGPTGVRDTTSMTCDPSVVDNYGCMDYCHKKGFNDYKCQPDKTCSCFNTEDTTKPANAVGTVTDYEGTTEEPDDESTTEEPDHVDTTEEPDDESTTEESDHEATTEEPDDVSTTEEPDHKVTTEESDSLDTTEEPDDVDTTAPAPTPDESPVEAAASPDDQHGPVNNYNCSEACVVRCKATNRPIARCTEDPHSCDCFAPPPPAKEPDGMAEMPVDAVTLGDNGPCDPAKCLGYCVSFGFSTSDCLEAEEMKTYGIAQPCHCGHRIDDKEGMARPGKKKNRDSWENIEMACDEKDGKEKCKKYCSSRDFDTYECQNGTCQCLRSLGLQTSLNRQKETSFGETTTGSFVGHSRAIHLHDKGAPQLMRTERPRPTSLDSGTCLDEECAKYCQGSGHCKSGNRNPINGDPSPCECTNVTNVGTTVGTNVEGSTKGPDSCDPDTCSDHCLKLGYQDSECLIDEDYPDDIPEFDEPCRCLGETISLEPKKTEMDCTGEDGQRKCMDYCIVHEFPVYECSNGTCLCYHVFQRRTSVIVPTTQGKEITISVPCTWEDEGKSCSADCKRRKFQVFECLGDTECHCFKPDFLSDTKPFAVLRSRGVKHRNRRRVGRMFRRHY